MPPKHFVWKWSKAALSKGEKKKKDGSFDLKKIKNMPAKTCQIEHFTNNVNRDYNWKVIKRAQTHLNTFEQQINREKRQPGGQLDYWLVKWLNWKMYLYVCLLFICTLLQNHLKIHHAFRSIFIAAASKQLIILLCLPVILLQPEMVQMLAYFF